MKHQGPRPHTEWSNARAGTVHGAMQRLWQKFGKDAEVIADLILKDEEYVSEIAQHAQAFQTLETDPIRNLRRRMNGNFFGPAELYRYLGIKIPTDDMEMLTMTSPVYTALAEFSLEKYADSHLLVMTPRLSIQKLYASGVCPTFCSQSNPHKGQKRGICYKRVPEAIGIHLLSRQVNATRPAAGESYRDAAEHILTPRQCVLPSIHTLVFIQTLHWAVHRQHLWDRNVIWSADTMHPGEDDSPLCAQVRYYSGTGEYLDTRSVHHSESEGEFSFVPEIVIS